MTMVAEELFEDVQHSRHLSEDEDTMTTTLELTKKGVQSLELSTIILDESQFRKLCHHVHARFVEDTRRDEEITFKVRLNQIHLPFHGWIRVRDMDLDPSSRDRRDTYHESVQEILHLLHDLFRSMDQIAECSCVCQSVLSGQSILFGTVLTVEDSLTSKAGRRGWYGRGESECIYQVLRIDRRSRAPSVIQETEETEILPSLLSSPSTQDLIVKWT